MWDLCRLIWWVLVDLFRPRAKLEAEILVLRQQINVLRRTAPKRLLLSSIDRLIFVGLYRLFPDVRGRADDRQAGYRDPLAPGRVQSLLALEIENPRGTAKGAAGDTPVDP
jgi:hypothetical protein